MPKKGDAYSRPCRRSERTGASAHRRGVRRAWGASWPARLDHNSLRPSISPKSYSMKIPVSEKRCPYFLRQCCVFTQPTGIGLDDGAPLRGDAIRRSASLPTILVEASRIIHREFEYRPGSKMIRGFRRGFSFAVPGEIARPIAAGSPLRKQPRPLHGVPRIRKPRCPFKTKGAQRAPFVLLARPERFELPTAWFVVPLMAPNHLILSLTWRCRPLHSCSTLHGRAGLIPAKSRQNSYVPTFWTTTIWSGLPQHSPALLTLR